MMIFHFNFQFGPISNYIDRPLYAVGGFPVNSEEFKTLVVSLQSQVCGAGDGQERVCCYIDEVRTIYDI